MTNINPESALELGIAMARASWDAALRSNAQASAFVEQLSRLQTETLARLVDETLRTQKEMAELGNRLFAASAQALSESLEKISMTIEQAGDRKTAEPLQTAEAGVRRRERAA